MISKTLQKWLSGLFVVLLVTLVSSAAFTAQNDDNLNALWVAESQGLLKLATVDGRVLIQIPHASDIRALDVDAENGVLWAASSSSLRTYAFNGVLLRSVPLPADIDASSGDEHESEGHDRSIEYNPNTDGVFLASEHKLYSVDANGNITHSLSLSREIEALSFAPEQNILWVGTERSIDAYDASSLTLIKQFSLSYSEELEALAFDKTLNQLWVATEHGLFLYSQDGQRTGLGSYNEAEGLIPDGTGKVWLAGERNLYYIDASGITLLQVQPFDGSYYHEIKYLVADPADQSVWVSSKTKLAHITPEGVSQHQLDIGNRIYAMALYSDIIAPTIEITAPETGTWLNTAQPALNITINDVGIGVDLSTLSVTENDSVVSFGCTVVTGDDYTCTPDTAQAEGMHTLSFEVSDYVGNTSGKAVIDIGIDTIAPVMTMTSPEDGLITNQASQTLVGEVSESATLTVNGFPVSTDAALGFQYDVSLIEGSNAYTISATDKTGNQTSVVHTLVLDTIPPEPVQIGSVTFEYLKNGQVSIKGAIGSAEPNALITITNTRTGQTVTVQADSTGSFVAIIDGVPSDTFAFTAADKAQNVGQKSEGQLGGISLPPDPKTVAPPNDPTVIATVYHSTQFLYTGANPIQTGVAPNTIEPKRASVIRGKVTDRANNPLPGVKITVHYHNEFGQTLSRADGEFDMAVNGGGILIANYELEGYLPVQRKINVPWQDFAVLPDVVMIPLDRKVTTIDLSSTQPIQVARGNVVTDEDGTRQATIFFPQGTTATMELPDGTSRALTTLNVRATEYTVGKNGPNTMPGELPTSSGYTYAVELSVDEAVSAAAKKIKFSRPVTFYIDNFLNFPVGAVVPVGFYERDKAAWEGSDNGRVIKIMSTDAHGLAVLDVDGTGQAASAEVLAILGIDDAERQKLAMTYEEGKTIWRSQHLHFSPWDHNYPYGPPDDAELPNVPYPDILDIGDVNKQKEKCGSIIGCQNQTLGESIPILGTKYSLNYKSDRVPGWELGNRVRINVTGSSLPASVRSVLLRIRVLGKQYNYSYAPSTNLVHEFVWDGLDAYGNAYQSASAYVEIGYMYDLTYYASRNDFLQTWNRFRDVGVPTRVQGRNNTSVILWKRFYSNVSAGFGRWDARMQGLGGWTISLHHGYDPVRRVLRKGDGENLFAKNINYAADTLVNNVYSGRFTIGDDGSIYYSTSSRIIKISSNGQAQIIAGASSTGYSGDGGLATSAYLRNPTDISLAQDGSIIFADTGNNAIRKIRVNGIIETIAGTGTAGFSGDEGLAINAKLSNPTGIAIDKEGNIYIADQNNNRLRKITVNGHIYTVAGTGVAGFSGDGMLAINAQLNHPYDVDVDVNGVIYISDTNNHLIRRITPDGIIKIAAGTGKAEDSNDGDPAVLSGLHTPQGVYVGYDGLVYIADSGNNKIKSISKDGMLNVFLSGDLRIRAPGRASYNSISLHKPIDIMVGNDSNIYLSSFSQNIYTPSVIKINSIFPGFSGEKILISSEDASEIYEFSSQGKHLRTLDALTGTISIEFLYGSDGYLSGLIDGDGNMTKVERTPDGVVAAVVSPDGNRMDLMLSENNYLSSVIFPDGNDYKFKYLTGGLLAELTDLNGRLTKYSYDSLGRLTRDQNALGGGWSLKRSGAGANTLVSLTSALGKQTTYETSKLSRYMNGSTPYQKLVVTSPSNTKTTTIFQGDGSCNTTYPNGTVAYISQKTDPRFAGEATYVGGVSMMTPGGRWYYEGNNVIPQYGNPSHPLDLASIQKTHYRNNGLYISDYDVTTNIETIQAPSGRKLIRKYDKQGRIVERQYSTMVGYGFNYDSRGRLVSSMSLEPGNSRAYYFSYNDNGFLDSIKAPNGSATSFEYDAAGRITGEKLPDGRLVKLSYDAAGNLVSVVPPGKSAHIFTYNDIDQKVRYLPPEVGAIPTVTEYSYNLDKELTRISIPDGQAIDIDYDTAGRKTAISTPHTQYSYVYNQTTSQLSEIATSDGSTLTYQYDGFLPLMEISAGEISGVVSKEYDSNLWLAGYSVNGELIPYEYDADGLLMKAGDLKIDRDVSGLVSNIVQGKLSASLTYNQFGELSNVNMAADASITHVLHKLEISDDVLMVDGVISNASRVLINTIEMTVDASGKITGQVPLPILGYNDLNISVYDMFGNLSYEGLEVIFRAEPTVTPAFDVSAIVTIAPSGDIYFLDKLKNMWMLPFGSGSAIQPEWLSGVLDVSIDNYGKVYTVKSGVLWVHDGATNNLLVDISAFFPNDMEVGPDNRVYFSAGQDIYVVDQLGIVTLHTTIPNAGGILLDSSDWGLTATISEGATDGLLEVGGIGNVYRVSLDGSISLYYQETSGTMGDLSIDSFGNLCYVGGVLAAGLGDFPFYDRQIACTNQGIYNEMFLDVDSMNSLEFDSGGKLFLAGQNNIYRKDGDSFTPLLSGTVSSVVKGAITLTGTAGSSPYRVIYERDKIGRISSKIETVEDVNTSYNYKYDMAGRLIEVKQNGSITSTYTYDSNGNRLTHNNIVGTYDEQDRLVSYGGASYSYTLNGELLSKTEGGVTTQYVYDVFGNLRKVILPGDILIEYVIDGRNRRVGKKVNGVLVQGLLYQDQLNPIAELDETGNIISRFVYGSKTNVPDYMIRYNPDGSQTNYLIVSDGLGSPRLVIDAETRDIVQRLDYDEFGNILADTKPGFQPFGYAGGIYDQHTRLTRFGARDYSSEIGRWLSKDYIRFYSGDLNFYGYVVSDPINYVDESGFGKKCVNGSTKVKGTQYSVRKDKGQPNTNQQDHAHIYDNKGNEIYVINEDGSPSHGSCPGKLPQNKKLLDHLSKIFKKVPLLGAGLVCYDLATDPEYDLGDAFNDQFWLLQSGDLQ